MGFEVRIPVASAFAREPAVVLGTAMSCSSSYVAEFMNEHCDAALERERLLATAALPQFSDSAAPLKPRRSDPSFGLGRGQDRVGSYPSPTLCGHHSHLQLLAAKADRYEPTSPNLERVRCPKRLNGLMVADRPMPRKVLLIVRSVGRCRRGGPRGTKVDKHR